MRKVPLVKGARIVRREMLNINSSRVDGSFEEGCQEASISKSLLAFVGMILDGPNNLRHNQNQHHKQQRPLCTSYNTIVTPAAVRIQQKPPDPVGSHQGVAAEKVVSRTVNAANLLRSVLLSAGTMENAHVSDVYTYMYAYDEPNDGTVILE